MTDRNRLYDGLTSAAWGYVLLYFDINLGTVSILPRFAGYLLLLQAVRNLAPERRDLSLLRPLGILLAVWSAGDWLLSWGGGDIDGHVLFADLLITAAQLYFHFQFLTDMAALAERYQRPEEKLDRCLLRRRTEYVLLITAIALIQTVNGGFAHSDFISGGAVVLAVFTAALSFVLMLDLFTLRSCFKNPSPAEPTS